VSSQTKQPKKSAPKRKWSTGWRRWVKWLGIIGGTVFVLCLALFALAYARTDIPDPNEGYEAQTSYVYYADGKTVLGKFAEQNRTSIDLDQVPTHVQDAVVAAEDRTFWTNKGIDPKGILRAAFNNASGGSTQGASTITQQYVKVFYLSQDQTWSRKAKEAILSLKIQRQMSKEEILEGYLNTIYFGRGAYGIEAAARAYFLKPAKDLTLQEGAALAAIINSPSGSDPEAGRAARQALKERYDYILDGMTEMDTMPSELVGTQKVYRLPEFPEIPAESQYGGQRGHVLKMVRAELVRLGFTDKEIDGGGLRITTTFTKEAMDAAEQGVFEQRPDDLKELHVAVASVEPKTGALRGMFAGQDYLDSQLNWAVSGGAPGSTFKPFSLVTGLTYGYSLQSTFNGSSPLEVGGTEFNNQGEGGGESYGIVSLLQATEESINTAYIDMVDSIPDGPAEVVDSAVAMGIPADAPGLDENLSMVLGSATVSPIDMANAYGTIADGGLAKDVYVVESVKTADGEVQYSHSEKTNQAISEDVAADASYALQKVTEVGTGTNANTIGRPVAGKTGTATDDEGHVRSSWFVGYTPQLVTAVMYSRGNGNEPLDGFLPTFYGGEYPARTWAAVMSRALEGEEILEFPEPAFLEQTVEGHEPTPTYDPTPTSTSSPSPTQSSSNPNGNGGNGSGSPSPTPSQSPTPTQSTSPSPSPTQSSSTPSPTQSPSSTPSQSPSQSPTGKPSASPAREPAGAGGPE
jgi:membrane peptidoglycan carboxypeptidase